MIYSCNSKPLLTFSHHYQYPASSIHWQAGSQSAVSLLHFLNIFIPQLLPDLLTFSVPIRSFKYELVVLLYNGEMNLFYELLLLYPPSYLKTVIIIFKQYKFKLPYT